jgi:two-component system phosphate regulon sensor histidine kinase PhoR
LIGKTRLLWQIFPSYLLIILISLLAATWYASSTLRTSLLNQTADDLEARARLLENLVLAHVRLSEHHQIDAYLKEAARAVSTRITVVLPSGKVIADSHEDAGVMDNHADRPEVKAALRGSRGVSSRFSRTLGKPFLYVGVPVFEDGTPVAVIRSSVPTDAVERTIRDTRLRVLLAGLAIAAFAALLGFAVSRRLSRPLEEMRACAESLSRGDFRCTLSGSSALEITALADTMTEMARQMERRINTITAQRNELTAVLSSMVEGVLAVDPDERLVSANEAASRMLQINSTEMKGRSIQEVVRNTLLQRVVASALTADAPIEKEIPLYAGGERTVQATGSPLYDSGGRRLGALIVLNDITRLRKLENLRREFVANVSHELKTPITAIKGFVETLQDGAILRAPEGARFLAIIERHVRRLEALIDDLLSLSQIEQDNEKGVVQLKETELLNPLKTAVQLCHEKAVSRGVRILLTCREGTSARINEPLIEQAIVNLLDNAIKYSDAGAAVHVEVSESDQDIRIRVRDQGRGIESQHLPRLFERFYRVEKGRTRASGGTGLGLAIVKHIAHAHAGSVSVESEPGKGSTFTLVLPKAPKTC